MVRRVRDRWSILLMVSHGVALRDTLVTAIHF